MKCYITFSYYEMDRGISNYTVFIPTSAGMKIENVDIHESFSEEDDGLSDLDIVKRIISRKYKTKMSFKEIKPDYHGFYR